MSGNPLLTQTAEYALRAMACLTRQPRRRLTVTQLAERTHVPRTYLSKVMRRLVVAGLVSGKKGHHGGFKLALPPHYVRLADILMAVDALPSDSCVYGEPECDAANPCPLHDNWLELKEAYVHWMHAHTLQELEQGKAP